MENYDLAVERLYNRFNAYNTEVLVRFAKTIKKFETLTPSEAHENWVIFQKLKI